MRQPRSRTVTFGRPGLALAGLSLLVLISGVSRMFLVCFSSHAGSHVELAHAEGHCGEHEAPDDAGNDDCEDAPLRIEPTKVPDADAAADVFDAGIAVPRVAETARRTPPPLCPDLAPDTGPPRVDARTLRRRTVVLLV
jgi:hypothetical protein